jgi:hypothetical protein
VCDVFKVPPQVSAGHIHAKRTPVAVVRWSGPITTHCSTASQSSTVQHNTPQCHDTSVLSHCCCRPTNLTGHSIPFPQLVSNMRPQVNNAKFPLLLPACLSTKLHVQHTAPRCTAGGSPSTWPAVIMLCVAWPNASQSCCCLQHIHDMLRSWLLSAAVKFAFTAGQGASGLKARAASNAFVEFVSSSQVPPPSTSGPTARKPLQSVSASHAAAHCRATCPLVRPAVLLAVRFNADAAVCGAGSIRTSRRGAPMAL